MTAVAQASVLAVLAARLSPPREQRPARRPFTVAEYRAMGEAGILRSPERVELICGEVLEMTPIGSRHASAVDRAARILILALGDRAVVRGQNPLELDAQSEPEPDLVVARWRDDDYSEAHPQPSDVLLVIEVADSSYEYDRRVKLALYARSGVPEVWIENLPADRIEIFRGPHDDGSYAEELIARRGDQVAPAAFPDLNIEVVGLLGKG